MSNINNETHEYATEASWVKTKAEQKRIGIRLLYLYRLVSSEKENADEIRKK